ncbi:uncharacterized protein LOC142342943 [Convolutriloba macropyga]|uniref:uncharacterized protein LOC142342943 n=1 Tax=Convolutriloba macropyga TaxID=536237 RepID=UPI003F51C51B
MKTIWTLLLEKEFIVTNMEHRDQKGLPIAADEVDHKLSREVRMLSVPGVEIPGVKYSFQLNQYFGGVPAQIPLRTSESTYPSGVVELTHLRVVTEHTIDIHFTFKGTAATLDVWSVPSEGSCPCTLDPIGLEIVQVSGLTAGQDYKLFMQLTSAYGKKGPIESIEQAAYTDKLTNSTSSATEMVVLNVIFESGTGSEVLIGIKGQLGTIQREYSYNFAIANSFRFSDLDPGDLYTIEMSVISLGRRYTNDRGDPPVAVVRNYLFQESTYPVEPTIVTAVTVTEHTIHFGWTNPVYFEKIYIWTEPDDGGCPCVLDNQSPNDAIIEDLVAGKEYRTHYLAESAFGRNSTQGTFTQSLYTDIVSLNNTLSTHRLQTEVEFESGVGSTVEMELVCSDFPLSWRKIKMFSLQVSFTFDDVVPGSAYSWTITGTSQGSKPLQRTYSFSDSTLPMQPISLVKAAYSLQSYDTFIFTIGDQPYTVRSTTTLQFTWAQERRIEEYKISDVTLNRQLSHVIASSGWTLDDSTQLTPGNKYIFVVSSRYEMIDFIYRN